ncbi:MAG: tetratricopeptide repeat protein, partial [Methyloprofundus sp.]|nr:tetratricopeptide repeat protein [Methyloprofundus sp.]
MSSIQQLYTLVDQQQFSTLKLEVEAYLSQSGDIQALPLKALAFAHLDKRVEAEKALLEAESHLDLLNDDALVDIAGVYCLMFRINEAKYLLEAVIDRQSQHALALARLAWCYMQRGNLGQAIALYQQSVDLKPNRLPIWSALSRLYLQVKNITSAQSSLDAGIICLNKQSEQLPFDAVTRFTEQFRSVQLELWVADDNIAQAEQWLEQYQSLLDEEKWAGLIGQFVSILSGAGEHAIAEDALISALKIYPKNEL